MNLMAPRRYSIGELLDLRGLAISNGNLSSLAEKNPDIASIVRESGSESSNPRATIIRRHKDDSSVTSDEVLFKGNMKRRPGREITNELAAPEPTRETAWKIRGRSDTEMMTGDTLRAPASNIAQRSEGFQRFYKAVVSPTHVRVTAGGRIVPNTRGPSSPTSKRPREASAVDSQSTTATATDAVNQGKPAHASLPMGPIPMLPPFMPGVGLPPYHSPLSYIPMAFGQLPPGFAMTPPSIPAVTSNPGLTEGTLKETQNAKAGEAHSNSVTGSGNQDDKIRLSPPEQFDHTRPFFYNGQWMYPIQGHFGGPLVPVQMLGIPPGLPAQLPTQAVAPQQQASNVANVSTTMGSGSVPPAAHTASSFPGTVTQSVSSVGPFPPPPAPPISSIRPSVITKKQISSFKASLKYHEDQLQYNRHQIDEKDMENKVATIREHIQRFEAVLRAQLLHEEAYYPRNDVGKEEKTVAKHSPATQHEENMGALKLPRLTGEPERATRENSMAPTASLSTARSGSSQRSKPRARAGINSTIGEGGKACYDFSSPDPMGEGGFHDFSHCSSLPSQAALAPPFQPRGYASSWIENEQSRHSQVQENSERRLQAPMSHKAPNSSEEQLRSGQWRSTDQNGSSCRGTVTSSGAPQEEIKYEVPYLVGTLPAGVNPRTAQDSDYTYVRPLTEEETRARFLYWGKAPKSVRQGLPKYDGRHFYPASPVKTQARISESPPPSTHHEGTQLETDNGYKHDRLGHARYRPVTPVQGPRSGRQVGLGLSIGEHGPLRQTSASFQNQLHTAPDELAKQSSVDGMYASSTALKSRDNGSDVIAAHDKRSEKSAGAKLLQAMLKKGSTSSAISSTTAQGYLPQYAGFAAASLTPSVSKHNFSPIRDQSPGKLSMSDLNDLSDGGAALTPDPDHQLSENRPPPNSSGTLDEAFSIMSMDNAGHAQNASGACKA